MRLVSLIVFLLSAVVFLTGGVEGHVALFETCGLSLAGVGSWKLWQFLTYGFLHAHWWHVLVNVVMLWFLGQFLQRIVGVRKAMLVLLAGVIGGGLMHSVVLCLSKVGQDSLLIGVSGGVMALLLCLTTLQPYRVLKPFRLRAKHLGLGFLISSFLLMLVSSQWNISAVNVVENFLVANFGEAILFVAHGCHFGGALAGLYLGRAYLKKYESSKNKPDPI